MVKKQQHWHSLQPLTVPSVSYTCGCVLENKHILHVALVCVMASSPMISILTSFYVVFLSVSDVELRLMWTKIMENLPELSIEQFKQSLTSASVSEKGKGSTHNTNMRSKNYEVTCTIFYLDQKILEKLFILCDETGDEVVQAQKFMAVASMLVAADIEQKFVTAFSFYDISKSGNISKEDASAALLGCFFMRLKMLTNIVHADEIFFRLW